MRSCSDGLGFGGNCLIRPNELERLTLSVLSNTQLLCGIPVATTFSNCSLVARGVRVGVRITMGEQAFGASSRTGVVPGIEQVAGDL